MALNEKLTRIIRGRTIELLTKEGELVEFVFDDHSTMRVKVVGGPTVNVLNEGKLESVREEGAELYIHCENGSTARLRLAEPGSSVTVTDKAGRVEYFG
jgi:hypothetical protein